MSICNIFLCFFIIYFRPVSLSNNKDVAFLRRFLTLNNTLNWFKNETLKLDSENKYCSICCFNLKYGDTTRKCGLHTMCIYERNKTGSACKGLIAMHLSIEEIETIVDAHNTLRNRVALGKEASGKPGPQPPAANMRMISWDTELAEVALRWAQQCVFQHDFCRDLERFPVGQNVARGGYGVKNNLEFIKDWYLNVADFDKNHVKNYRLYREDQLPITHYTQLVWADTYLVGCARVAFQKPHEAEVFYKEHFFCNYGPSGNLVGQPIYKIGESCSYCLEGTGCTSVDYPGLCGNEIMDNNTLEKKTKIAKGKRDTNMATKNGGIMECWMEYFVCCSFYVLYSLVIFLE